MKRVLVCVLDWGLGHAARAIPVIREFRRQGADVAMASSNEAGRLLREEFPGLNYHELPGYAPRYQSYGSMMLAIAAQSIRFSAVIKKEQHEVEALVKNLRADLVVSDNRYGCYSTAVPSIYITHQYEVRLPRSWSAFEPLVNRWQRSRFRRFQEVWIPDQPGSGLTEAFVPRRAGVTYVGWLSRFGQDNPSPGNYPIVAVVSGPEPQRRFFENILRKALKEHGERSLLVTGQPGNGLNEREGALHVVSHLPSKEMEQALRGANLVIARSGYSTIMDLIELGKKAILVPTPQQPEQMILAGLLHERRVAFCPDQQNFAWEKAVRASSTFNGFGQFKKEVGLLELAIRRLL